LYTQGQTIQVKLIASNQYGHSDLSQRGQMQAVVQDVPDAPTGLENDAATTTDTLIKIMWQDGQSDGGTPVISYSVFYD
jgi:hypothetical protein